MDPIQHPPNPPIPIQEDRIWIDGCFDFAHHGHAGAILQAKQLGKYLVVGVHSDEDIFENKGPTVMTLKERIAAVQACKWTNLPVPNAPYVTEPEWLDLYGCKYVVHGDDITTDSSGEDCYRLVKSQGRFKIVARTPGISTTDLVGRMLLCTKQHHMQPFALQTNLLSALPSYNRPTPTSEAEYQLDRIRAYASDEFGSPGKGSTVFSYDPNFGGNPVGTCLKIVDGQMPHLGQRVVYVDGGFDLFSSGHIEFLKLVVRTETNKAADRGEYQVDGDPSSGGRKPYVVAGVHDDKTINKFKGLNYPIMNLFERALCVLQCRFVSSVILSSPFVPTLSFLATLPTGGIPHTVYHGPTKFMASEADPYAELKKVQNAFGEPLFREIPEHEWSGVNAGEIVGRIVRQRALYEERQRRKEGKAEKEGNMTT
ncbi:hypothetical protein BDZ91DRAFT_717322 [Kalaharituber pfeilii]|nr:hypothetical protein BDZ91DRAFT_717322 [Kalaharituber pfeilii]